MEVDVGVGVILLVRGGRWWHHRLVGGESRGRDDVMECFVGIRYLVCVEEAAGVGEVFDG